jgi:hypothetical protein
MRWPRPHSPTLDTTAFVSMSDAALTRRNSAPCLRSDCIKCIHRCYIFELGPSKRIFRDSNPDLRCVTITLNTRGSIANNHGRFEPVICPGISVLRARVQICTKVPFDSMFLTSDSSADDHLWPPAGGVHGLGVGLCIHRAEEHNGLRIALDRLDPSSGNAAPNSAGFEHCRGPTDTTG